MRSLALHCAAARGHLDVVKLCKAKGYPKDETDVDGTTPAEWAETCGHTEILGYMRDGY